MCYNSQKKTNLVFEKSLKMTQPTPQRVAPGNIACKAAGDITEVTDAVVVHQTNCQNAIGMGVAGSICKKWPVVKTKFHEFCKLKEPEELFGLVYPIAVDDNVIVCNVFAELHYGDARKTGKKYTDEDVLVDGIKRICEHYPDRTIVIPEKIGCGLAGGDWGSVEARLSYLPINIVSFQKGVKPDLVNRVDFEKHN